MSVMEMPTNMTFVDQFIARLMGPDLNASLSETTLQYAVIAPVSLVYVRVCMYVYVYVCTERLYDRDRYVHA